ncbi:MAG: NAD(+)--rifampin ADP-ribosyltransferase [Sphingobacterium sp.]|jgi:rifampin ADP-ribosylating transferase|nr:NAD(+)--rifampin ADP-ribosyltransferase [Sphingobacterium sp.]MDR0261750.1 NAD(+)--rifampin ADP-ribosyltransferase [Sphingobacterium sp.]
MEFSPFNHVVKLCIQGMRMEEEDKTDEALDFFMKAWMEAADDHEKLISAYFVARQQKTIPDRLHWLQIALDHALVIEDDRGSSALPGLYSKISEIYTDLGEEAMAAEYARLASSYKPNLADLGPFYHGTKATAQIGDLLTPGFNSNYKAEFKMNHIYFTAMMNGAGLAAALAKGDGKERVFMVEPTGDYENDPNLTDQKFPGNPTRSYRSEFPLRIIGEVTEWKEPGVQELEKFKEKLDQGGGEIIN